MPRSIKKGPFVDQYLIDKISKMNNSNKTAVKTWPTLLQFAFGLHSRPSSCNSLP